MSAYPQTVVALEQLASRNGAKGDGYAVTFNDKGKLVLPDLPHYDDTAGQCAWLTSVFTLNPAHPITGGEWHGTPGPEGAINLRRADAKPIRFEPARNIKTAQRLREAFTGRRSRGDGRLHAFTNGHCDDISYVIECLSDMSKAETDEQQTIGVIGTFLQEAAAVEGHTTYGTTGQRYEAATALRIEDHRPHYLIDAETGELVIAVSDLAAAARKHVGSSLARGWLDARMDLIGWQRIRLDGRATAGRAGRTANHAHATVNAYRGHLNAADDDEAVTK